MNNPILISEESYQIAWARAVLALRDHAWSAWNMVVHITNPNLHDMQINNTLHQFANRHGLINPLKVEHTIFPTKFYRNGISREELYRKYSRFYKMTRHMEHAGWGTYFNRMINYDTPDGRTIDQLGSIIDNINNRVVNYQAAHTMIIPYPHNQANLIMGSPCLNYITVQVESSGDEIHNNKVVNMLAVYRNHDFRERAYGNYKGLLSLLTYIANETHSQAGKLTCVSSHAYICNNKRELTNIATQIIGG